MTGPRGPVAAAPEARQVHVHPLPAGHVARADCACRPIVSSPAIGVELFVHRDLMERRERPAFGLSGGRGSVVTGVA
jgi:hypothetical protein